MGGSSGTSAAIAPSQNDALTRQNSQNAGLNSGVLQNLLSQYGSGQMSLKDAMANINANKTDPNQIGTNMAALATDPVTGSRMASEMVQNDPLSKGLFGQGGIQDQAQGQYGTLGNERQGALANLDSDRNALMGKDESYGLNQNDLKAYGQASGNVARMFGSQQQNLAQALADRGLAAGGSGIAAQKFSGLQGNQAEQLGQLQQQIAQNRINTARGLAEFRTNTDLQRQMQTQQAQAANNALIQGLGGLGQEAQQNQYGRQLSGAQNLQQQNQANIGNNLANRELEQNVLNEQFSQQQATKAPSLGESIASGFTAGAGQGAGLIGKSPGTGADAFAKSYGGGLGKMAGGMGG